MPAADSGLHHSPECQNNDTQLPNQEGFAERQIGQSNAPDTSPDERKKIGNQISDTLF